MACALLLSGTIRVGQSGPCSVRLNSRIWLRGWGNRAHAMRPYGDRAGIGMAHSGKEFRKALRFIGEDTRVRPAAIERHYQCDV